VVIIGAGTAGSTATHAFIGIGAQVSVLDNDLKALQRIHDRYRGIVTLIANPVNVARACAYADVVVGSVLIPGERAPIVVTRQIVQSMKPRSIIIDVSIDEGGCVETSRPTTHDQPTFIEEGVIHYCVPNIPGIVARTSTHAFINTALPFLQEMADKGVDQAIADNPAIEKGLNIHQGKMVHLSRYVT
jgi:alanine dehydrogenase